MKKVSLYPLGTETLGPISHTNNKQTSSTLDKTICKKLRSKSRAIFSLICIRKKKVKIAIPTSPRGIRKREKVVAAELTF